MKSKILWAIQYCQFDHQQAEALVRLCTELTVQANSGKKSPHADLIVCVNHLAPLDMEFVREASRAFNHTRTFRCRNRVGGWPDGCNNSFAELYAYYCAKQCSGEWSYSGIWFTEPDSVPLAADFLARVHREWSATDKLALGYFVGSFPGGIIGDGSSHLNGNLVLSHKFADVCSEVKNGNWPIAWDAHHRHGLVRHGYPSQQIYSDYQLGSPRNPWDGDCAHLWRPILHSGQHPLAGVQYQPSWVHGPKLPAALECARERLLKRTRAVAVT